LEIARFGALGEAYGAPFEVVDRGPHHRLRRYASVTDAPVALLVPPLMVTAEVYDVAPDVSAVSALGAAGVEPWVVDFGAPERERGGMDRSLDDHIRAIVASIKRARELTGRDVHLCGYSQGGMFAYQTAAFLRGEGIASVVTFGSPIDLHKNLPAVRSDLAGHFARTIFPAMSAVLDRIEGLPGKVTSTAFKIVSTRKEVEQRIEFLRSLHDRDRIMKREARRRFLGGGGFVAWPGPAFKAFVDEFVVHNRMMSGGFVIDGRTVSLADLKLPILAFIGGSDEIARPATVRAIVDAAPDATVRFETVRAGHFGIVVGSRAMTTTWPLVAAWIKDGGRLPPPAPESVISIDDDLEPGDFEVEFDLAVDVAARAVKSAWNKVADVIASANATVDTVRWQEPRLRRLAGIDADTKISAGRELAKRAKTTPDATFFLWHGRAFSFRDADTRVTNVARGLHSVGVKAGDKVGVWMASRPSLLATTTALSRLGAVAIVAPPNARAVTVRKAFADTAHVVVDPGHRLPGAHVLGAGSGGLEKLDVSNVELKSVDEGRAADVALVLLRPGANDELRPIAITNHRWALSAIGAAAVCTLEAADTVFCAVPLHHPTGLLVSVGAALAGGSRLALVELDPNRADFGHALRTEIRRVGATVVFYTGEMLRPLLGETDRHLPVRLFAGSGMRPALAAQIRERFNVDTIEFYAGTTHHAILADASGEAPGSLGTVLPGSGEVMLVRANLLERRALRPLVETSPDEPGLLAVRRDGEEWFVTNDVLRRDPAGKFWFVDALSSFVNGESLRAKEDALYTLPEVTRAVAWEANGQVRAAYASAEPIAAERLPFPATYTPVLELSEGFRVRAPR
jgi:putative long chain acyl-CoA synthase